ncbi:MAG: methyltransferase domain-containing protein [Peptococcaceae bacterium]|nr:methyltransferase domain-containing protein [Peptococcaceae bacterium]
MGPKGQRLFAAGRPRARNRPGAGLPGQVDFRQGDAGRMPLQDDNFDFVVCTAAFKNFPDPVQVPDEIFRVLKPGGKALIEDLRRNSSWREIKEGVDAMGLSLVDSLFTKLSFKFMLVKMAYTPAEIRELAAKSKFARCDILEAAMGMEISLRKQGC